MKCASLENISNVDELGETIQRTPQDTTVIVDFDHTLFLSNSTEEYLNSIRPKWLLGLVLGLLGFFKPWRLFRCHNNDFIYRDHFRVVTATLLFPWAVPLWRSQAAKLANEFKNEALIDCLKRGAGKKIVVGSYGYAFLIRPLLEHMPIDVSALVASNFLTGHLSRRQGKSNKLRNEIGAEALHNSIFVTDSLDDADVIRESKYPALIRWPNEKVFGVLQNIYLPYIYTEKAKYPNDYRIVKIFFLDDLPTILLSITFVYGISVLSVAATVILYTSFICIYELGYRENDFVAVKKEAKPTRSKNIEDFRDYPMQTQAWVWAAILSCIGITLLNWDNAQGWNQVRADFFLNPAMEMLAVWSMFLLFVRGSFWLYNSISVQMRIFSFQILQMQRTFGLALIMSTNVIGASFMGAQVISRWMCYILYRYEGQPTLFPEKVVRSVIFMVTIAVVLIVGQDLSILFSTQFWLILFWSLARGAHQILDLLAGMGIRSGENGIFK